MLAMAVGSIASLPAMADSGGTSFYGSVSEPSQSAGIYSFSTSSYSPQQIKRNVYASGGGIADDNYYYGVRYEVIGGIPVIECTSYSLKNWGIEDNYTNCRITNVATDLAYFAPRDEAYGCYFNESGTGYVFGKSKLSQFSYDKIADLDIAFAAMDFDAAGTLFAIDWTGRLHTVDTSTGELTYIGDTGKTTSMITGGVIDRESGIFYFSVKTESESAVYAVDLATASAVKAYDLENEEQLGGMYIPVAYADGAPAAASNPTVNFSGTSLSGTLRFRAPQKSLGNEILTGNITYYIEANGELVATGETSYDAGYINVPVELTSSGRYCFSLYFSNEAGRGPRSKTTQFIGPDIPKAPGSPRLTYNDGTVKIFWNAAGSTGVNGGNIDRTDLHYKIKRFPDGEEFRADASGWSQQIDTPETRTAFHYEIRTVAGSFESEPASTPEFYLGTIEPPYADGFETQLSTIGWSWINNDSYIEDNYSVSSGMRLVTMNNPDEGSFLVSPAIALVKGRKYEIGFSLKKGNSRYDEMVGLTAGNAPTAEALSAIALMEPVLLDQADYVDFSATFEPTETGIYYLALHGVSPDGRMIYMRSFSIGRGVASGTPGAVTNLSMEADIEGGREVTVSFNLPDTNLEGGELTQITSVELLRDNQTIKVIEDDLVPGAAMTMTDDMEPTVGNHLYTVVCHNDAGNGIPVSGVVWVGFNVPEPVEWVKVKETETPGTVDISWAPADVDIDGKSLANAEVVYSLYDRDYELVKSGLTETNITIRAQEPLAPQAWAQYRVVAVSEGGESEMTKSMLVPIGPADVAPWKESWPNKEASHMIGTTSNSVGDTWMVVGGFSYNGRDVDPQDNDGGMMGVENTVPDETISLFTAKIDLSRLSAPALSFWVYNYIGDNGKDNANELAVKVLGDNDDEFMPLTTVVIGQTGPKRQWNKVVVPLEGYDGQTVRIRLEATVVTAIYIHLDNISVDTSSPCNLALTDFRAPLSVSPDTDFDITAVVSNNGDADIAEGQIELMIDGEVVENKPIGMLASGSSREVVFSRQLSAVSEDVAVYSAKILAPGDLIEADNESEELAVTVRRNGMPGVSGLSGVADASGISLTWNAPDFSKAPASAVTEGFESATAWKSEVADWTFLDLDRATIGGIGKKQLPVSGQQSFFVIDDTFAALNGPNDGTRFKSHSGKHSLWSMYSMRGNAYVQSDDWAISPELYGGPQMISLWASSFESDPGQPQYLETFEVLASEGGISPEDFTLVERIENVPASWTRYEFYLPDGTERMAIRGVSYDKYILMIDDVEFVRSGGSPRPLTLKGYHVYRDNMRITDSPIAETSYSDNGITPGRDHAYRVSAVYAEEGETRPSDEIVVSTSGTDMMSPASLRIASYQGGIEIRGAGMKPIRVARPDGIVVFEAEGLQDINIPAPAGIYLISVGEHAEKMIIR